MEKKSIGLIGNYYGGLYVMEHKGRYYWCIENHDTDFENIGYWVEIEKELFDSLISHQERLDERHEDLIKEEEKMERNGNLIAEFMEHCKEEGLTIPDSFYESYFNA